MEEMTGITLIPILHKPALVVMDRFDINFFLLLYKRVF